MALTHPRWASDELAQPRFTRVAKRLADETTNEVGWSDRFDLRFVPRAGTGSQGRCAVRDQGWRSHRLLRRQHHGPAALHDLCRNLHRHAISDIESFVRPFRLEW